MPRPADVSDEQWAEFTAECKANAALIECAPDLLDVLKRLIFDCKADRLQYRAGFDVWIAAGEAAIARAEGRQ